MAQTTMLLIHWYAEGPPSSQWASEAQRVIIEGTRGEGWPVKHRGSLFLIIPRYTLKSENQVYLGIYFHFLDLATLPRESTVN